MKTNEQDEMIGLFEFAKIKGIDTAKVVEMIRDGYYVGKKVGDDWFVSRSELYSEPVENQEYVTSLIKKLALTKKLALIEMIVIVFYIVLTFNSEMAGIAYLFLSPVLPLVFAISFLITGFKFEKKLGFWKGMFALNVVLFLLLSSIVWFGNMFSNFR